DALAPAQPASGRPSGESAARHAGRVGAPRTRLRFRGIALLVDDEAGWLARPDGYESPERINLDEAAHSLEALLRLAEGMNLGHRNGRGRYSGAFPGYGQLWLLPAARARLGLPAEITPREEGANEPADQRKVRQAIEAAGWKVHSRQVAGWTVIRREGDGDHLNLHLVVPEWQTAEESPFGERSEPAPVLAKRLGMFAAHVGVVYSYSPGVTGVELIKTTRPELARTARPELPKPSTVNTLERDYRWQRPVQPDEETKRWVDAWDINAMYLGAARSLPLGIGAPVELTGDVQFDKNLPGYWRIANPPAWEHARLPDPLQVDGRKSSKYLWVTTPTMKTLIELYELDVEIDKAWVWQPQVSVDGKPVRNSVRVLDKWAEELGNA